MPCARRDGCAAEFNVCMACSIDGGPGCSLGRQTLCPWASAPRTWIAMPACRIASRCASGALPRRDRVLASLLRRRGALCAGLTLALWSTLGAAADLHADVARLLMQRTNEL